MAWWNPLSWFGSQQEQIELTQEERIAKAKALEQARNYVEAAIVLLRDAEKIKSRLSTRDMHKIQSKVHQHLDNARREVVVVNEQLIDRILDDIMGAISYSRSPQSFYYMGDKVQSPPGTNRIFLTDLEGLVTKINTRLSQL